MGLDVCISSYLGLSSAIYSYFVAHRDLNIGLHSSQSMPGAALGSTLDLFILRSLWAKAGRASRPGPCGSIIIKK
jgi:hypothetical protein